MYIFINKIYKLNKVYFSLKSCLDLTVYSIYTVKYMYTVYNIDSILNNL